MPARPPSHRLFYALWPDAAARASLERLAAEAAASAGGRAPRAGTVHVTVAFLGSVADERLDAARAAGAQAARAADPFEIALVERGGNRHGLAWLAPAEVPAGLVALHGALVAALRARGFAVEARAFRPHATLARNCTAPLPRASVAPVAWTAQQLVLLASSLGPGGAAYAQLAGWPLAREPAPYPTTGTV